ncbi:DUF4209 domain-containing protein [Clostridium butyricum]|uniref:DUF4209 domain-containing protein n=1 Tax=Clostridium butyricum TaxID=1492 RepID=UPI00374FDB73
MKSIFTSKYGFNMRNNLVHGILYDSGFKSVYAIYKWYFILRLCFMNSRLISLDTRK